MSSDHRDAVDEVRAWLVAIRGGSPFLSPADGWRLVRWLDQGVPVSAIALAIERASAARRARRVRWPLGLGDASRYLKVAAPAPALAAPSGSAQRLCSAIRALDPRDPQLAGLADRLADASGDPEAITRRALAEFRLFFEEKWASLDLEDQAGLLAAARAGYGDWLSELGEAVQLALVEEAARDALRARYPALTAELVWTATR
jgi:hypothetical protein